MSQHTTGKRSAPFTAKLGMGLLGVALTLGACVGVDSPLESDRASAASAKIAFEACPHDYGIYHGLDRSPCDIYLVDADTGALSHLTTGSNPVWSPDGQRLLFTDLSEGFGGDGTYIINSDGSNMSKVVTGLSPAWTPDGSYISYVTFSCNEMCIHVARPDGTGATTIASGAFSSFRYSWSPRGDRVAYVAVDSTLSKFSLYVAAVDSHTGKLAEPKPVSAPDTVPRTASWFPDGKRVAYRVRIREPGGGRYDIYSASVQDARQTRLTTTGYIEGPLSVSPDGSRIAYLRIEPEGRVLSTVNTKGLSHNN